ncbi:MAG: hypothetical protein ACR2QJ_01395 [Geminicoccaceae bacterium]
MSRSSKRQRLLIAAATMTICSTLTLAMTTEAPLILYPITPSLPPGLYTRTFAPPKPGMIATFRVPEAAKRYKASIGEHVHDDFLFMKPIVARPGDHVCADIAQSFSLNGVSYAPAAKRNRSGHSLPVWRECHHLRSR